MAKIREPESDPEIENSEDGFSEEEGSEDEAPQPKTRSLNSHSQKLPNPPSSSEEEDEEGSDSDSDVPIRKSDPGTKSTANDLPKPTAASSARKPRSKTTPVKPGAKRPAEKEVDAKVTKKSNKKAGSTVEGGSNSEIKGPSASAVVNDDPKKQLFQRIWSEEDEIVILNGMIEYSAKNKADPVAEFGAADFGAFLEFIKKSLHIEVTKTQLQDKVRRLKKKFVDNASKEKTSGKKKTFSKPHDQKLYELSEKIWGKSSINNGNVSVERVPQTPKSGRSVVRRSKIVDAVPLTPTLNEGEDKGMKNVEEEDRVEVSKIGSVSSGVTYSNVAEWILKDGAKMLEREKREEMEEKWKKIQKQEVEVFLKRTELMREQTKLVLEAMRKSDY